MVPKPQQPWLRDCPGVLTLYYFADLSISAIKINRCLFPCCPVSGQETLYILATIAVLNRKNVLNIKIQQNHCISGATNRLDLRGVLSSTGGTISFSSSRQGLNIFFCEKKSLDSLTNLKFHWKLTYLKILIIKSISGLERSPSSPACRLGCVFIYSRSGGRRKFGIL